MTQLQETIGGDHNGSIPYIEASLPEWMGYDELEEAYRVIGPEIIGDNEPPAVSRFYSVSPVAVEDYRRFIVEFSDQATVEEVIETVKRISFAILRYRKQGGPETDPPD